MSAQTTGSILSGYLRKFWFRTHPDFFQGFSQVVSTNKSGIQTVNDIVASSSAAKGKINVLKKSEYSVSLYYKKNKGIFKSMDDLELYNQKIIVPGKLGMITDRYERDVRLQAFSDFTLYEIIKSCGIDVQDAHLAAAATRLHSYMGSSGGVDSETGKEDLMTKFQRRLKEQFLEEEYNKSYVAAFRPDMIFFHPTIPEEMRREILNKIKFHLPKLRYPLWRDLPILINDQFSVLEKPLGFMQVPAHFVPHDFANFVKTNSEKARSMWKQNVDTMRLEGKLDDYLPSRQDNIDDAHDDVQDETHDEVRYQNNS